MANTHHVRPGQVYRGNRPVRLVRVLHLEVRDHWRRLVEHPRPDQAPTHARVETVPRSAGVQSSIKLSSLHADPRPRRSGYTLLEEAPDHG